MTEQTATNSALLMTSALPKYLEIISQIELPEVLPSVRTQLHNYMNALIAMNEMRGSLAHGDINHEIAMFYFKCLQFYYSRDKRVEELASAEIAEAMTIKNWMFPLGIPKMMLCVDGRVLSKLAFGLTGNALRTPAGDSGEFMPKHNGTGLWIASSSTFARILDEAIREQKRAGRNVIVEVLDSHVGCAARGSEEAERDGKELPDKGLARDVLRKKEMAEVIHAHINERYAGKKRALIIQTSFDPHSGFCYMGLEKELCLKNTHVKERGFTTEVLESLVAQGHIISTKDLVESAVDRRIKELFSQFVFDINYEIDYATSTLQFWKNLKMLADAALPIVEEKLIRVYPALVHEDAQSELRERAMLLLANAYSAFLHHDIKKTYPYGEHDESIGVVTFTEKGPYDRARSFSVDPSNPNISGVIAFIAGLIRGNRKAGRMSLTEQKAVQSLFPNKEMYVQRPVPVMLFERLPKLLSDVEKVQQTDWSDLVSINWMDSVAFRKYLLYKIPDITLETAAVIERLRQRAVDLFAAGQSATPALLEGRIIPLWTLTGPDRRTIALFPFLAKGYTQK